MVLKFPGNKYVSVYLQESAIKHKSSIICLICMDKLTNTLELPPPSKKKIVHRQWCTTAVIDVTSHTGILNNVGSKILFIIVFINLEQVVQSGSFLAVYPANLISGSRVI